MPLMSAPPTAFAEGKILMTVDDRVGIITFNNPDKRNAMSLEMWEGLGQALVALRDDVDIRVVVLTGAGDKAFVSGADISQFGIPAARLGIAYGHDGLRNLVSLVGPSQARLLLYTGMRIDAEEALRIGLVDRMMASDGLLPATLDIARTISQNAPLAIKAAKITIAEVLKDESRRDMEAIKAIGNACMDSADFREGRQAFMEKRKPRFTGT